MAVCQDCGKKLRRPEAKRCAVCQSDWYQQNNLLRVEHLRLVRDGFIEAESRVPSVRELAGLLDWGVATVHHYLKQLEAEQ